MCTLEARSPTINLIDPLRLPITDLDTRTANSCALVLHCACSALRFLHCAFHCTLSVLHLVCIALTSNCASPALCSFRTALCLHCARFALRLSLLRFVRTAFFLHHALCTARNAPCLHFSCLHCALAPCSDDDRRHRAAARRTAMR